MRPLSPGLGPCHLHLKLLSRSCIQFSFESEMKLIYSNQIFMRKRNWKAAAALLVQPSPLFPGKHFFPRNPFSSSEAFLGFLSRENFRENCSHWKFLSKTEFTKMDKFIKKHSDNSDQKQGCFLFVALNLFFIRKNCFVAFPWPKWCVGLDC